MYKINVVFVFIFIIVLSSCGSDKRTVIIDNPTPKGINIKFKNGFTTSVEAWGQEKIIFSNDSATVYIADTLVGDFILGKQDEYILNPTRQYYYIEEVAYGSDLRDAQKNIPEGLRKEDSTAFKMNFVMVDTLLYIGYVKKVNDLLIPKKWDYGISDQLPEQLELPEFTAYATKIKIFREYDFIRFHDLINLNKNLGKDEEKEEEAVEIMQETK
ncbi:MAG TPA: hypothetical protein VK169_08505 [Saprospiraceae bacterium]|nr:hypothetical protein [Saprospiraceae bacterium]